MTAAPHTVLPGVMLLGARDGLPATRIPPCGAARCHAARGPRWSACHTHSSVRWVAVSCCSVPAMVCLPHAYLRAVGRRVMLLRCPRRSACCTHPSVRCCPVSCCSVPAMVCLPHSYLRAVGRRVMLLGARDGLPAARIPPAVLPRVLHALCSPRWLPGPTLPRQSNSLKRKWL
jgi:hypothetical protein